MRRWLIVAAAGLLAAGPAAAQQQGGVHVVREGDTLWDLARTYLGDPFLWPEIFRLNTDVLADPARISPSMRLRLPAGVSRVSSGATPQAENSAGAQPAVAGDFYRAALLVQDAEIRPVGQLAELESPSVVPIAAGQQIHPYDRVFVALAGPNLVRTGDQLHLLRREREITPFGRVYRSTGIATVAAVEGSTATVVIGRMYDKVAPGDLAVPFERVGGGPEGALRGSGGVELRGRIVAFQAQHPVQMTQEIAFVDLGLGSGVRMGDELVAYLPRQQREWGIRPEIEVARLQVVRITEQTASVRITGLRQPALEAGLPVRRSVTSP